MLHVRVTAQSDLGSGRHSMELDICTVSDNMGKSITLIDNGVVAQDVPFPVVIDLQRGFIGEFCAKFNFNNLSTKAMVSPQKASVSTSKCSSSRPEPRSSSPAAFMSTPTDDEDLPWTRKPQRTFRSSSSWSIRKRKKNSSAIWRISS